jgi:hypothetical protein
MMQVEVVVVEVSGNCTVLDYFLLQFEVVYFQFFTARTSSILHPKVLCKKEKRNAQTQKIMVASFRKRQLFETFQRIPHRQAARQPHGQP